MQRANPAKRPFQHNQSGRAAVHSFIQPASQQVDRHTAHSFHGSTYAAEPVPFAIDPIPPHQGEKRPRSHHIIAGGSERADGVYIYIPFPFNYRSFVRFRSFVDGSTRGPHEE